MMQVPDNEVLEAYAIKHPWLYVGTPIAELFGVAVDSRLSSPVDQKHRIAEVDTQNEALHPTNRRSKSARVSQLKDYQLFFHRGVWVTASDIIKYVAYHGYGVHSVGQKSQVFDLIEEVKYALFLGVSDDGGAHILYADIPAEKPKGGQFRKMIDLPLLYLFTIATYLVSAPDVQALEAAIDSEVF